MSVESKAKSAKPGREGEFSAEVSRRVPGHKASACEEDLQDLVLMVPQLLERLNQMWQQPEVPPSFKRLSGYVRSYLCHPHDIIPEADGCLFGYADDAYLAAEVYLRAADSLPYDHPLKRGQEREFLLRVRALRSPARFVIAAEAERIDAIIDALLAGDDRPFQGVFSDPAAPPT